MTVFSGNQGVSDSGGGSSEPITTDEVITLSYMNASVVGAAIVDPGTDGTPGTATVTGTTGVGTKCEIDVTITNSVESAIVGNSGDGSGTPGAVTITGTTGTGTRFQATGTIDGDGLLVDPLVISVVGSYTVNPTIVDEPVTSDAGLVGATVVLTMAGGAISAIDSVSVAGSYTVPPTDQTTEPVTGGALTGATLNLVMSFAPSIVGSDPTKGIFFDSDGVPGIIGGSSGLMLIGSPMTISSPVAAVGVDISGADPAFGCLIRFSNWISDPSDLLCCAVSSDGGNTYFCDTDNFDTYSIFYMKEDATIPTNGNSFNDAHLFDNDSVGVLAAKMPHNFSVWVQPGPETVSVIGSGLAFDDTGLEFGMRGVVLNVWNATNLPENGNVDYITFFPYGNGDCPPTGSGRITSGSLALFGVPLS